MIHVVLDAQRGDFYVAGFELSDVGWQVTSELRIVDSVEAKSLITAGGACVGPCAGLFGADFREMSPEAFALAGLAAGCSESVASDNLEPVNLREFNFVKAPAPRISMG